MSKRGRTRAQASRSPTNEGSTSDTPSLRGRGRVVRGTRSSTSDAVSSETSSMRGRGRVVRARIETAGEKNVNETASQASRSRHCLMIFVTLSGKDTCVKDFELIYRQVDYCILFKFL